MGKIKEFFNNNEGTAAWLATIVALLAFVASIYGLYQNSNTNASVISLAQTADARADAAETRAVEAHTSAQTAEALAKVPNIRVDQMVFNSYDMGADEDVKRIDRTGLVVSIIPTAYQDAIKSQVSKRELKYLFITFENVGPGLASNLTITSFKWIPRSNNVSPPMNSDDILSIERVVPGTIYALLVDVAENLSDDDPMKDSNAEEICLAYSYSDESGKQIYKDAPCLVEKDRQTDYTAIGIKIINPRPSLASRPFPEVPPILNVLPTEPPVFNPNP